MQFFIIHQNPETNAKMLPDYAIKQVNVREGWQILSDIGHNLGVEWEGQNKPYSVWHAETRRFMVNREAFLRFVTSYEYCLDEYFLRFGKTISFHDKYHSDLFEDSFNKMKTCIPAGRTHEQFMADYMLRGKGDKLTEAEKKKIEGLL